MLLRPKGTYGQLQVAAGCEKLFGRDASDASHTNIGLVDLQISREQGVLQADANGRLELTCRGAGRMRVLRRQASELVLVSSPPYMPKGEKVVLLHGDEVQLLVARRREGEAKATPQVVAA